MPPVAPRQNSVSSAIALRSLEDAALQQRETPEWECRGEHDDGSGRVDLQKTGNPRTGRGERDERHNAGRSESPPVEPHRAA
jgi:hypothetical protein